MNKHVLLFFLITGTSYMRVFGCRKTHKHIHTHIYVDQPNAFAFLPFPVIYKVH